MYWLSFQSVSSIVAFLVKNKLTICLQNGRLGRCAVAA